MSPPKAKNARRYTVKCNTALKKGSTRWSVVDTITGEWVDSGHCTKRSAEESADELEREMGRAKS